jgi:hypothetical protein
VEATWWACLIQSNWRVPGFSIEVRSEIMFNKAASEEEAIGMTYKYINGKNDYDGCSIKIVVAKCPQN